MRLTGGRGCVCCACTGCGVHEAAAADRVARVPQARHAGAGRLRLHLRLPEVFASSVVECPREMAAVQGSVRGVSK